MENKTSKYLKYAIGEILLVVIGILIALQINTWHAERKNNEKAEKYAKNLIEDIAKDTLKIKQDIEIASTRKVRIHNLFKYLENESIEFEQKKDSLTKFPIFHKLFISKKTTYEDLNSNSNLNLFNHDKRTAILNFYSIVNSYELLINSLGQNINDEIDATRKYLEFNVIDFDFEKAFNYKTKRDLIIQGLKHKQNALQMEVTVDDLEFFGKEVISTARKTIALLKEDK